MSYVENPALQFTSDWVSNKVEDWTKHIAGELAGQPVDVLEIGCHEGRSTAFWLSEVLTNPHSRICCVDPWPRFDAEQRFCENLRALGNEKMGQVTLAKGFSWQILASYVAQKRKFDFVYIDGDHEGKGVLEDFVQSFHLLKPNGLLLFDDYNWRTSIVSNAHKCPPRPAIDAVIDVYDLYLDVIYRKSQVLIRKRSVPKSAGQAKKRA